MTTILLVEDNEMNRDMLGRRLQRQGFDIRFATDGDQAAAVLAECTPALILMDISLPGKDGHQLTREIKANPATADIPVIALTAHAMTSDRERAFAAGCDDYDTKPVEFKRLMSKIRALLGDVSAAAGERS